MDGIRIRTRDRRARPARVVLSLVAVAAAIVPTSAPAAGETFAAFNPQGLTGFDSRCAPSLEQMAAWKASSPHAVAGIYVGGRNKSCRVRESNPAGDVNLTAEWVRQVIASGWRLIPTFVGYQAPTPCGSTAFYRFDPAQAAAQGKSEADETISAMQALGFGVGTVAYYDMEAYNVRTEYIECRNQVLTFLSAWAARMNARGYVTGLYSSAASGIREQARVYDNAAYTRMQNIWYAWWGREPGYADTSSTYFPTDYWVGHRIHQYAGGHNETHGGVTINVDSNHIGGDVVGPGDPLTVVMTGGGVGTVTSDPWRISCGARCTAPFAPETQARLIATPATGSIFQGWSGDCTGTGSCTVTMGAARSVQALFEPSNPVTSRRVSGTNRFETAASAAATFGDVEDVVIATGRDFPDAVAAAGLAGVTATASGVPILLTEPASLPGETADALVRGTPVRCHVLGGLGAVSQAVRDDLAGRCAVVPYAGANRFDTAAEVATTAFTQATVGTAFGGLRTAMIATGRDFPDALALGPLAYAGRHPVLLVETNTVPTETREALVSLGIQKVVIAGGTGVVNAAVQAVLQEITGYAPVRYAGSDRNATATKIADAAIASFGASATTVSLASGRGFADALAAGPLAGARAGLTVLAEGLPGPTETWLRARAGTIAVVEATGGTGVISNATLEAARRAATPGTVTLTDNAFSPKTITVPQGTTVSWAYPSGSGSHSVTSDTGSFTSGTINASRRTYARAFPASGRYPYHCTFHGAPGIGMSGVVVVS